MTLEIVLAAIYALQPAALDRTKPPQTPPISAYKLPPVYRTQLPNGLQIVLVEDRRFPLVTVRVGFPAGGKYDSAEMPYLAETAASLLTEGTATRKSRQLAEELASLGANIHATAGRDTFVIAADAPSDNAAGLMKLLADVTRNASFPDDEIQLRKQNRIQEVMADRAQSSTLATEKTLQTVFGSHPYSRMLPSPPDLERITRAALTGFRDSRLIPNSAVFVFIGAIPPREQAVKLIEENFGGWPRKAAAPVAPSADFPGPQPGVTLVDRSGSVQADIAIVRLAVTKRSPDYFPLMMANAIYGGSFDSRLFNIVREKQGFAYDAHSELNPLFDAGYFSAVTQVRNEVVEPAIRSVMEQMTRMAAEPVGAAELDGMKNFLNGIFVLRLETQDGLADQLVQQKLGGLPENYIETYVPHVRAVTAEQVQAAAAKYMVPGAASIIVVGDAAQISKQVEKIGQDAKLGKVKLEKAKQ